MSIEERVALWWGVNMTPEGLGWGSLITREKNLINSFRPKPKPILKLFHSCNLTISTYFNITLIFMTINPLLDQGFPEWEGGWVRGTTLIIFLIGLWLNHSFAVMIIIIIIVINIHAYSRIFSWSVCSWKYPRFCYNEYNSCTFISHPISINFHDWKKPFFSCDIFL